MTAPAKRQFPSSARPAASERPKRLPVWAVQHYPLYHASACASFCSGGPSEAIKAHIAANATAQAAILVNVFGFNSSLLSHHGVVYRQSLCLIVQTTCRPSSDSKILLIAQEVQNEATCRATGVLATHHPILTALFCAKRLYYMQLRLLKPL